MGYWPTSFSQESWILAKFSFLFLLLLLLLLLFFVFFACSSYGPLRSSAISTERGWSIKDLLDGKRTQRDTAGKIPPSCPLE